MKIFEWVQRKFHFNIDIHSTFSHIEDGVVEHNMKKLRTITSETDSDALLDHIALTDVQQDWKDRLLSIGTLGLDPLEFYNHFDGHFVEHIEEEADDDVVDEGGEVKEELNLNPLVVKAFRKELGNALLCLSSSAPVLKSDLPSAVDDEIDTPLLWFLESAELQIDRRNYTWEETTKKKAERTTLADLFSAETDATAAATGNSDSTTITHQPGRFKKTSSRKKHGLSFARKFLSRKEDDDPLPITKVHRLIKKLLKKKIHPELQGEVHGTNGPSPISAAKSEKEEEAQSLSLLQGCEMEI